MTKKKLSKNTIIAIIIICTLVIAFAIFLPLYLINNKENRELYKEEKIKISAFGDEIGSFKLDELMSLENVQEKEFRAMYDTSNSEGIEKTYIGLELKDVLKALNIDLTYAHYISFYGGDGLNKVYDALDVIKDGNVYLAYKVEGEPFNEGIDALAYTKKQEDGGPFVIIKKSDSFSTNRCKLLTEIRVS